MKWVQKNEWKGSIVSEVNIVRGRWVLIYGFEGVVVLSDDNFQVFLWCEGEEEEE